jgi:hypothetical protein
MNCSGCGISIGCPDGCGVLCTSDCEDCTSWCEPTKVRVAGNGGTPGVFVRVIKGAKVQVRVAGEADQPDPDAPKYPASKGFQLSFNDLLTCRARAWRAC